jgi:hypothetical protein
MINMFYKEIYLVGHRLAPWIGSLKSEVYLKSVIFKVKHFNKGEYFACEGFKCKDLGF